MRNLRPIILMLALGSLVSALVWHYWDDADIEDAWFQLGQGSGWHGLETVKVAADGRGLYFYAKKRDEWALQRFHVPAESIGALKRKIEELSIQNLAASYSRPEIADGTQWVLLIKEGPKSKRIYCSNRFPQALIDLAEYVHKQIVEPRLSETAERIVPRRHLRNYGRELWESARQ